MIKINQFSLPRAYKRMFVEDTIDPYVQKLNQNVKFAEKFLGKREQKQLNKIIGEQEQINKISKKSMKTQKHIIKQIYELMPLRSRIKFHDKFGGDCLGDIYGMLKI